MKHKLFFMAIVLVLFNLNVCVATEIIVSHTISMIDEPKHPADFTHFDFVNPDAPKGGTLRSYSIGTYDTFHRYAQGGNPAVGSGDLYDTLMTGSSDEAWVFYGLIAEKIEYRRIIPGSSFISIQKLVFRMANRLPQKMWCSPSTNSLMKGFPSSKRVMKTWKKRRFLIHIAPNSL
jgi:ABC-type oligopeptide transport system substrate-binding subunit